MARDWLLEEMVREALGDTPGIGEKAMFGGLCWLLDGHMLCTASQKGMMARLGKGEAFRVQEMVGLVVERKMKRNHVGPRQQVVESDQRHAGVGAR